MDRNTCGWLLVEEELKLVGELTWTDIHFIDSLSQTLYYDQSCYFSSSNQETCPASKYIHLNTSFLGLFNMFTLKQNKIQNCAFKMSFWMTKKKLKKSVFYLTSRNESQNKGQQVCLYFPELSIVWRDSAMMPSCRANLDY